MCSMQSLLKAFLHSTSKMGQFITTKVQHFMIAGQLGYVLKIHISSFYRLILYIQDLWFLRSAHRLMLVNISMKFHGVILNDFQVTVRPRFCDRQTDGQTTMAKTICLPTLKWGDKTKHPNTKTCLYNYTIQLTSRTFMHAISDYWRNVSRGARWRSTVPAGWNLGT